MIGRLKGILVSKSPPWLLVDVNGVGYELEAPMSTFYDLPEAGREVVLLTHHVQKEDSVALYGFLGWVGDHFLGTGFLLGMFGLIATVDAAGRFPLDRRSHARRRTVARLHSLAVRAKGQAMIPLPNRAVLDGGVTEVSRRTCVMQAQWTR